MTVTVFGTDDELAALDAAGLRPRRHDRGPEHLAGARRGRARPTCKREDRADAAALDELVTPQSHEDEIVVLRVDYFENYAGRFLSVEAKDRLGGVDADGRDLRRAGAVAVLQQGRGHADRLAAAADEREHRPGHDAGHVHRASRARPDRRRRHRPPRADADPHRLEHRRRASRPTSTSGSAAACRR